MYICEDCYYGERPPMEMCNLCTKDEDGRMSCWTPKCKTPIGAVLQEEGSTSQSVTLSVSPAGRHLSQRERQGGAKPSAAVWEAERAKEPDAQEGQEDNWMASDPERDKDLLIDHLKNRIHVLEKERDDCAAGYDYLQCKIDDLREQMGKLEAENEYLRKTLDWNKREQEVLSGKLEMVYLIFGGGGDG